LRQRRRKPSRCSKTRPSGGREKESSVRVYQGGKKVGVVQEYSDTLLIFLLKGRQTPEIPG
jgi:hypothetical protein